MPAKHSRRRWSSRRLNPGRCVHHCMARRWKGLRFLWAAQGTPCGRLLAAALADLVPRLRRLRELNIDDETAAKLLKIAPATIDRRLKGDRPKLDPRGRSH